MPVIHASDQTHFTMFSGTQHAWPLYLMTGNMQKDIPGTPNTGASILVSPIPCPLPGSKTIDEAWNCTVGTVLSQPAHHGIAGPSLDRIVRMDSSDNITLYWLPGSEIIQNKLCLHKSNMADVQWAKFRNVRRWGIPLFDHWMTQESSVCTQSCWRRTILMLYTLQVSTQSATSSGNSHSAMSIAFGSLMNCISCSWV